MPTLVPLDNTIGAGLIGLVLSTLIYGITWLQVYHYYTVHSSRDGIFLKIFVAVLMVLDTVHVAFLVICLYHYTVNNFGDYIVLQGNTWSLVWQAFVGGLLSDSVDAFFAFRVYKLSGHRIIFPIVIGTLCLAKLGTTIGFTVTSLNIPSFNAAGADLAWSTSSLATNIACDSIIATSMIYYLRKGRTGFSRTNRAINLLITYALNTCLITGICNTVCMILWVTSNTTLLYALFYFILVRLYSCSFMSTLNSRENVRKELNGQDQSVITMSKIAAAARSEYSAETDESILKREHPEASAGTKYSDTTVYRSSPPGVDSITSRV